MTSEKKRDIALKAMEDTKVERAEVLDVQSKTPVADYFIVGTGTSGRHVRSIADAVEEAFKSQGLAPLGREGERTGWVLLDYGDVVVHVMQEEQRQFYDLESLWKTREADPNLLA